LIREEISLNQSNFPINEVLKASLETQHSSVSFDKVWNKYSNTKKPFLEYKKLTVLVAAVLFLLISSKYLNDRARMSKSPQIADKAPIMFSMMDSTQGKDTGVENKQRAIAPIESSAKKAIQDNSVALNGPQLKSATISGKKPSSFAKIVPTPTLDAGYGAAGELVIWQNITYSRTVTIIPNNNIGKKLGETSQDNILKGSSLYVIKTEDIRKVIAIKVKDLYYRAEVINTQNK
jgi:hypothetical protein